ncbi:fibroblast growth factor receptor 2 [Parasteatoda tepidariorum]|uniref:fibroblast growth factor receptor 2 n=1 Tax=Parasteatoda tepidariorum TaxID=114398 RepID=UPI0039BD0C17
MMNGASPYPGITPQRLYNLLKAGYRMTKPDYCPDEVYLLMRQCWRAIPRERPSFKELVLKLDFVLQDTVEYMDFVPKSKAKLLTPEEIIIPSNVPSTSVKYTTVLLEDDEDDISGGECNETIGLVSLFEQAVRD